MKHYYHIYADGNWQLPLREHIQALTNSGLLENLNGPINVGIVGLPHNRKQVRRTLREYDVDFAVVAQALQGWEQMTLDVLHAHAQREDEFILYAHTKGATGDAPLQDAWRRALTYGCVTLWQSNVLNLEGGAGTSGCLLNQYMAGQVPYYAGNFWWATSSTIRTIGVCANTSRFDAEVWIGEAKPHNIPMANLFTVILTPDTLNAIVPK